MRPAHYRNQWNRIKASPEPDALRNLARRIGDSFIDRYFYSDRFDGEYIELLCEMATGFSDEELNSIAAGVLFGIVIERLCDDFEEMQTETYNRLMCQVITYLRKIPAGQGIDDRLNRYGLQTQRQLYDRIESVRVNSDRRRLPASPPKKILLLSRVTIGADVAISSVICQRLMQLFPDAELVMIGPAKLREIYQANTDIRLEPLDYTRRGNLVERFSSWLQLLDVVEREAGECRPGEVLLFDPDSRLSQLGVLPLIDSEYYYFFNSRGKDSYPKKMSIAELANFWIDNVFGPGRFCYPKVWPAEDKLEHAASILGQARDKGSRRIITINFGVGGNTRKKLQLDFEALLVVALLNQPGTLVLLDLGFGKEERSACERILAAAEKNGFSARSCRFSDLDKLDGLRGVVGVECGIGEIAALIACSDEFIGYDSACQHISAALGILTYTIFTGSNNVRFIRRWTAYGPHVSEIIYVDTLTQSVPYDASDIVERILDRRDQ